MADMNLKLSADVNGFRTALKSAQQSVKTLDAELKLNAAQMKAGGDAEQLMAERAELLKKQIKEQEKAVEAATKALEAMAKDGKENTAAFNQMRTALANNKTRLVEAQNALKGLGQESEQAGDKVEELGASLKNIDKNVSFDTIKSGISGITSVAHTAFNAMKSLATGVWELSTAGAEYADNVITWSQQYGLSTDTIQRMYKASESGFDVDFESILSAADKMMKVYNSGSAPDIFAGIDTVGKDRLEIMLQVIDKLNTLYAGDSEAADQYTQAIFGKSFRELEPLIKLGSEGYQQILDAQQTLSDDEINNLGALDDSVQKLNTSLSNLKTDFASSIAEPMNTITTALDGLIQKLDAWVKSPEGQAALENLGNAVAGLFDGLTEEDFSSLMDGAVSVLNGITGAFEWIKNNKDTVVDALKVIFGVFAGLEVTKGLTSILELVNGLTGLGGMGGLASTLGVLGLTVGTIALTASVVELITPKVEEAGQKLGEQIYEDNIQDLQDKGLLPTKEEIEVIKEESAKEAAEAANNPFATAGDWLEAMKGMMYFDSTGKSYNANGWLAHMVDQYGQEEALRKLNIAPVVQSDVYGPMMPMMPEPAFGAGGNFGSWDSDDLPDWGGGITESVSEGIDEGLTSVEDSAFQMGQFVGGAIIKGVLGSVGDFGGGTTNNFNMGNVTVNSALDVDGLAKRITFEQFNARRGFGG